MYVATYEASSKIIWNTSIHNVYHHLVLFFLFVDIWDIFQDI